MRTKTLAAVLAIMTTVPATSSAFEWYEDEDDTGSRHGHWLVAMDAGLNTDGYEADLSLSWWPVAGFGFKMALGVSGEIEEFGDWWWDDYDYGYDYGYGYDYAVRLRLMPSVEMRSPALLVWHDDENALRLFANPGVCLSPGAAGSRDAQWFNWQLRGGVEIDFDAIVLRLGYGYSNFNLYSGDPVSHHGYTRERDKKTHSGFMSLGFRF